MLTGIHQSCSASLHYLSVSENKILIRIFYSSDLSLTLCTKILDEFDKQFQNCIKNKLQTEFFKHNLEI
ncbi:hypothetical protein T4B_6151 [Trichinella pseudospiralis]|uniref:Uncharacterized protein n=1 Tax=Trichinella pseudospiralis TaxID=6337 RepID=A0A0V1IYS4_TRIPS|nr:hypothetical protein T4A_11181 [Trichinella pseudospiralis]KRZ27878.1 hypothetical protein T4B_6151 [Trichinella pseudospiralis]KRZ43212.1 hypothetical protein T4C_13408 [Trichinella pseudospiralis]